MGDEKGVLYAFVKIARHTVCAGAVSVLVSNAFLLFAASASCFTPVKDNETHYSRSFGHFENAALL